MKTQKGFAILPILLLAVIIGLVGVIGWRVLDAQKASTPSKQVNTQSAAKSTAPQAEIAPITSKAEAEKVQATLDSSTVEVDLDSSTLDNDLNDLL